MGATFNRVKTWIKETLTFVDLNAEFDNILNNLTPTGVDDESADNSAMQATADPYPADVESKATSLKGELHRLRFVMKLITGMTYWYYDPDISLFDAFRAKYKTSTKTATYTVTTSDCILLANPAANMTFTLPAVSGNDGKVYMFNLIKNTSFTTTITGNGSETIGKLLTRHLTFQEDYLILKCNEANSDWVILGKSPRSGIPGYKNLEVKVNATNPAYQIDIDADALGVVNAAGDILRLKSVNVTGDLTTAGANGLDTSSVANNTTYAVWVIYNTSSSTTAALLSTSFTIGGLTLPSNYTHARLVDFCRTATGNTQYLDEQAFATHAKWDDVGDYDSEGGEAAYTHSAGSGTLTQTNANMLNAGVDNVIYVFDYTVSSPSGDAALEITNAFAITAKSLNLTAGSRSILFLGAASASTADFVISGTSTNGGVTIDDVSLKTASIIPFRSYNGVHLYDDPLDDTQILSAGGNNTWTNIDTTNFAGNIAITRMAIVGWGLLEITDGTTSTGAIRPNGATGNGKRLGTVRRNVAGGIHGSYNGGEVIIGLDTGLLFQYKLSAVTPDLDLWLHGVYLKA